MTGEPTLLQARALARVHRRGAQVSAALRGVDFSIERGEFVALTGPSGSGKSTLLGLLGGLDRPTSGRLTYAGRDLAGWHAGALARWRNRCVGFVFQSFNLLPRLDLLDNVALPMRYAGEPRARARQRAEALLIAVGLGDFVERRPSELSGGQQQRVAIARAIANRPTLLLADEPTGSLDQAAGRLVLDMLQALHRRGTTIVLVTHDAALARSCPRELRLIDGRLAWDGPPRRWAVAA